MLSLLAMERPASMKSSPLPPEGTPLTARQWEVARLVALGYTTKRIAKALLISPRTVKEHVREAGKKVPGDTSARHRLTFHVLMIEDRERSALAA